MLPIVWRAEAQADFAAIITYIADRNPAAASRLAAAIGDTIERCASFPYIYRPGRIEGTREAVVTPNYIVVYSVTDMIDVVAVLHARQQYP
jgi:addiction module RelE/StbE family toxin